MLARVLYVVAGAVGFLLVALGAVVVPQVALVGVMVGGLAGGLVAARTPDPEAVRGTVAAVGGPRAGIVTGGAVLAGCLALAGLSVLLGPASGIVILILGLLAAAWWWPRRPDTPHPMTDVDISDAAVSTGRHEQLPAMLPPPGLPATLSTEQLCQAWQRSYFTLLDTDARAGNNPGHHLSADR